MKSRKNTSKSNRKFNKKSKSKSNFRKKTRSRKYNSKNKKINKKLNKKLNKKINKKSKTNSKKQKGGFKNCSLGYAMVKGMDIPQINNIDGKFQFSDVYAKINNNDCKLANNTNHPTIKV